MSAAVITLSLHDAATNCERDSATAVLTLRSGVQIEGYLEKPGRLSNESAHVKTRSGWATVLIDEIASVESRR